MLEKVTRFLARPETQLEIAPSPVISCVLIVHDMAEQAENTVKSLLGDYQRNIQPHEYEVIIVENESGKGSTFTLSFPLGNVVVRTENKEI